MYKDILKVYDQDCIIYDTSLENTPHDVSSGEYTLGIERPAIFEFNWQVWVAMLIVWAVIFLSNRRSVDTLKYVIYFVFPLSLIAIFVLVLFGITLGDGVSEGVETYLWGKSDKEYTLWEEL